MANRNWLSGGKIYSMHKDLTMLDVTVQIGSTGAVSSIVGSCIKSVTRLSTGKYKIAFQTSPSVTNFARLIFAAGSVQSASGGLSGVSTVEIQNAPDAAVSSKTAPALTVECLDATGAAVDPASGSALNVMMILSNSSVKVNGN